MDNLLVVLALVGQAAILLAVFILIFGRQAQNRLIVWLIKNAIPLAFITAVFAVSGSLYYSEIVGFPPCDLCWFQRIFMYPQIILLGLSWIKRDTKIMDYSLVLLSVGTLISVYHNYIYYAAAQSAFCSISSPCTQSYILALGYITIPLMSLISFILLDLILLNKKFSDIK